MDPTRSCCTFLTKYVQLLGTRAFDNLLESIRLRFGRYTAMIESSEVTYITPICKLWPWVKAEFPHAHLFPQSST